MVPGPGNESLIRMAKFKLAKPKTGAKTPQIRGGLPCVVLVCLLVVMIGVLLFLVMKYAS
jgi:hypothetical protein